MKRGLRTIVYTQSRKMTELIYIWTRERLGVLSDKLTSYRAGFLPEERREIEVRLTSGELLGVVSTSALELGIDIGSLDICILVGYPGTIMATWQRGGRVGRRQQDIQEHLQLGYWSTQLGNDLFWLIASFCHRNASSYFSANLT